MKTLVSHRLSFVVIDCVVIQGEKPPLPALPLKHIPHYHFHTHAVFTQTQSQSEPVMRLTTFPCLTQ